MQNACTNICAWQRAASPAHQTTPWPPERMQVWAAEEAESRLTSVSVPRFWRHHASQFALCARDGTDGGVRGDVDGGDGDGGGGAFGDGGSCGGGDGGAGGRGGGGAARVSLGAQR
eukprot:2806980-Pleurochrysis_carterae.AAC.1